MSDLIEDTILVNLQSQNASLLNNGTAKSNVLFNVPGLLSQAQDIHHCEIMLYSAQFPFSFYIINSSNNILNYIVTSTTYNITITKGNYSFTQLKASLQSLFSNNGHAIIVTLSGQSGCMTFTSTTIDFTLLASSSCAPIFGYLSDISTVSKTLTLPYSLNLLGPYKLKIYSTNLPTSSVDPQGNVLSVVNINAPPFGLIQYSSQLEATSVLKTNNINQIDIRITDENGILLDFNNQNWSISLRLSVYKYYSPSLINFSESLNRSVTVHKGRHDDEITADEKHHE